MVGPTQGFCHKALPASDGRMETLRQELRMGF